MRRSLLSLGFGFWSPVILAVSDQVETLPSIAGNSARRPDPHRGLPRGSRSGHVCSLYQVSFRGLPVILPSRLGIELVDGPHLGNDSTIENVDTEAVTTPTRRSRANAVKSSPSATRS